jgi:hypothetical protein
MVLKDQIGKNDSFLKCFLLKDSGSLRNLKQVLGMFSEEKRGGIQRFQVRARTGRKIIGKNNSNFPRIDHDLMNPKRLSITLYSL